MTTPNPSPLAPQLPLSLALALIKNSPIEKQDQLMAEIAWNRVVATPKELSELSADEDWQFLSEQILHSNPQYFTENIHNMDDLIHALSIDSISEQEIENIIQEQHSLIANASTDELNRLVQVNPDILKRIVDNLNVEDLTNFAKNYAPKTRSGQRKRILELLEPLEYEHVEPLTLALLPYLSSKAKKAVLNKYPIPLIRELGMILGLVGAPYEGANDQEAVKMAKERFHYFSGRPSEQLVYNLIDDYKQNTDIYRALTQHGDLQSIQGAWSLHAFSFNIIKEGKNLHIIYVNRGERHIGANSPEPAVSVFTLSNVQQRPLLLAMLASRLRTKDKAEISDFIARHLMPHRNEQLSKELYKKDQKGGNCTVANANIAWHLHLAAQEMKKTNCSFLNAYKKTRPHYKQMRLEDRAQAFCNLVLNPLVAPYRHEALSQLINKMIQKEVEGNVTLPFFLTRLDEKDPYAVATLFKSLCLSNYNCPEGYQQHWIEACAAKLKEKGVFNEEKQRLMQSHYHIKKLLNNPNLRAASEFIDANPFLINLVPKKKFWPLILFVNPKNITTHIFIEHARHLISDDDESGLFTELVEKFSADQLFILVQDKDIKLKQLEKYPGLVEKCFSKLSGEQLAFLISNSYLTAEQLKQYPSLSNKLSFEHLIAFIKAHLIDPIDLPEVPAKKYVDYCKSELLKALNYLAQSGTPAQQRSAKHLIAQVAKLPELKTISELTPYTEQATRLITSQQTPAAFKPQEAHRKRQKTGKDEEAQVEPVLHKVSSQPQGFFAPKAPREQKNIASSAPSMST